jgi:hypothetical protein
MMATYNKFNQFVGDLGTKKIDLNGDTFNILLTNTAPNAADTVVDTTTTPCTVKSTSNAVEIAAGNGYTKGGTAVGSQAYSQTSGTGKMTGNAVTFTASGGTIGPFQYAVLYDVTSGTTATRSVVGWWNYGSAITLNANESFTVGNSNDGTNWTTTYPLETLA